MPTEHMLKADNKNNAFNIETTCLICCTNPMTGDYMKCNIGLKFDKFWQSQVAKNDIEQPYGVFFEDQFNVSTVDVDLLTCLMPPQLTFTCSKSTIETLEKDVKHVQS